MKFFKEFNSQLQTILEQQQLYLDTDLLKKTREAFKLYHSAFNAVYNLLMKKALIREDPYKYEYKITEISVPPSTAVIESEKESEIGIRMSFFNTQLEFIDGRYVFTTEYLTNKRIKLLRALLNWVDWETMAETSENSATRIIASFLRKIRQGTDQISTSLLNTSVTQMGTTRKLLITNLLMVADFHNEIYKFMVRRQILESNYNVYKYAMQHPNSETLVLIRKKFSEVLVDQPFYPDLITEILDEEFASDSVERKKLLIAKLSPPAPDKPKKEKVVIKKPSLSMLVNAALATCSTSPHVKAIIGKLENNFEMLSAPQGFGLIKWFYKKFKSSKDKEKLVDIEYLDENSGLRKTERLNLSATIVKYQKLSAALNAAKVKEDFNALDSEEKKENYLLSFIDDNNRKLKSFTQQLQGIDTYTKQTIKKQKKANAGQMKGFLVEINAIKNSLINSQQMTSEYVSAKEEYNQLKKLHGAKQQKQSQATDLP